MNIYEKLQIMRCSLQGMGLKKSGKNKHMGYSYYELSDILPGINNLQLEHKTCSIVIFNEKEAVLTLVNSENPEENIVFTSPMAEASLKGSTPIQGLGAVETYERRYLYMTCFEIVENDALDGMPGKKDDSPRKPTPPAKKTGKSYLGGQIIRLDDYNFNVTGSDGKTEYSVSLKTNKCNCTGFKTNKKCFHLAFCRLIALAVQKKRIDDLNLNELAKDKTMLANAIKELKELK